MSNKALLDWAQKQPAWARDALRRIAFSSELSISDEDLAEVLARIRHAASNDAEPGPDCRPLAEEHLRRHGAPGPRTVLASLGPVTNIDRLAPDQRLRFAERGVTLVFGENGSGKSGYARIAKHLCRSLSHDELKGDVFADGPVGPISAQVRFRCGEDELETLDWTPDQTAPLALRAVSVFDSRNAGLYIDDKNQIAYLPFQLALLEQHGRVCAALAAQLGTEEAPIRQRLANGPPAGYAPDGRCQALLARMKPDGTDVPTHEETMILATLAEDETAELADLERRLAQDPVVLAATRRRAVGLLERILELSTALDAGLSAERTETFEGLLAAAEAADAAVLLSAGEVFAHEPMPNVGGEAWRLLFDAARAFAGRDGLPDQTGAPCPLCLDPLSETGADRMMRFNAFVRSEASRKAEAARAALMTARSAFEALIVPDARTVEDSLAAFADLDDAHKALLARVMTALAAHGARRDALVERAAATVEAVPALAENLQTVLLATARRLAEEAEMLEKSAAHQGTLDAARRRISDLRDRTKLGDELPVLLQRLNDLRDLARVRAASSLLGTAPITRQINVLRRALMTEDFQRRIAEEINALDLAHIPFTVTDSAAHGLNHFALGLEGVTRIKNSRILSEGEQRALALACFLAELGEQASGILVDDPVTSLDHYRMRKVAARLVDEAARGRQVIIFTHNLVFFNEVASEAARRGDETPLIKMMVRKSAAEGFGLIEEDTDPWLARDVAARIQDLRARAKSLAGHDDATGEDYRRHAKDFYSDLRESWERAVEETLLYKTIQRLAPDVMTQRLRGVEVTDEDYAAIFHAMKRASERSGHDMPEGRSIPAPTADEMLADLEALDALRLRIGSRRKEVEKRRKALEEPVKAALTA